MRRFFVGLLILLIILLCDLSIIVSATTESGTATIDEEEYYTWKIVLSNDGKISYEINVTNGLIIDVILYDEENYKIFLEGHPCEYVQEGTDLFTTHAKKSVNLPSGTYYLTADNTQEGLAIPDWDDVGNNSATFDYIVSYTLSEEDNWWNFIILGGVIVTIIIIVVIIMKKRRET